jgi:hypothetical protein
MRFPREDGQIPAICVHDLCWEVLSRSVDYATYSFWFEMMIYCLKNGHKEDTHMAPLISDTLLYQPETRDRGYRVFLAQPSSHSDEIALNSDISNVLLAAQHLSAELRLRIWEYLDEKSWTARVLSTLSRVPELASRHDKHAYGPSSKIRLGKHTLSSYNCENMGISCLNCVHVEPTGDCSCTGEIHVQAEIGTIEVVHSFFGLSALRFYVGGEKSDWLGVVNPRTEHKWHRYIKNQEQSRTIHFRKVVLESRLTTIQENLLEIAFGTTDHTSTAVPALATISCGILASHFPIYIPAKAISQVTDGLKCFRTPFKQHAPRALQKGISPIIRYHRILKTCVESWSSRWL